MPDDLAEQAASVGALAEPVRRALYRHVAAQPEPVSREQAAAAVGLPLHSVKFHLDKLVDEGLLEVQFKRLSGRTGPGAGRPSKLYQRSARQLSVSLPERHYDLAGDVLAAAIDRSTRESMPIMEAVHDAAQEEGRRIASQSDVTGSAGELEQMADVLAEHGYEPRVSEREVCLANCPFDRLAGDHTELVCGMNLALIGGVLDGLQISALEAELAPQPGFCCVRVRSAGAVGGQG